jgi:hypothetical protein
MHASWRTTSREELIAELERCSSQSERSDKQRGCQLDVLYCAMSVGADVHRWARLFICERARCVPACGWQQQGVSEASVLACHASAHYGTAFALVVCKGDA